MYGTVNEICERLRQRYKSDELMTLIIWTKEDVLSVLDNVRITDETADEILQQIDGLDSQHEYGVSLETLQAVLDNIREEERHAREATVPAAALEIALRVAWDFMRLEDAQSGEGAAARLYQDETQALLRVSAALRAQTDE
ncbi:DUF1380 family protein [Pantoea sp. Fr+CA_20]|uniref:DUF1380 family protein n=1 Tax=Pantoea sp. Fr+CA_20 TaxID=2929506 RepID=UPI0021190914|nr:DUF1380 family protein [Pantoea sp. Fr+CA_20]